MNLINQSTIILNFLLSCSGILPRHLAAPSPGKYPGKDSQVQLPHTTRHGLGEPPARGCPATAPANPAAISFPADTSWSCEVYNQFPNVTSPSPLTGDLATTGSGTPQPQGINPCLTNAVSTEDTFQACGNTFFIVRTWLVLDWCTGQLVTSGSNGQDNAQVIVVKDHAGPVLELPALTVPAGSGTQACHTQAFLPPANVIAECGGSVQRIFTPAGEAVYANGANGNQGGWIPFPGLALGSHLLYYQATDECGNTSQIAVEIKVEDQAPPVAVCGQGVVVSLDSEGTALVAASALDDGSHDNCCLDTLLARRVSLACGDSVAGFGQFLELCCADAGKQVPVTLRAVDCQGNHNDCTTLLKVNDKLPARLLYCPSDSTVSCDFYLSHLDTLFQSGQTGLLSGFFGQAEFEDNCGLVSLASSATAELNACIEGIITRSWLVTDPAGNEAASCQQLVLVEHRPDWAVTFPADLAVTCGETIPPLGEPEIFSENCELVAVSWEDLVHSVVPDACFKIERNWIVINWCRYAGQNPVVESPEDILQADINADGVVSGRTFRDGLSTANFQAALLLWGAQPDGYVAYKQVIKVSDETAPLVSCLSQQEVCIFDAGCAAEVQLPLPAIVDCSAGLSVTATGDLGTGLGPFQGVGPGTYHMTYRVADNCNNQAACSTVVTVKDCKKPTPFCVNGLNVTLGEEGIVTVNIEAFDAGSFDNCSDSLKLSFSPDVTDTTASFNCFSIGFVIVRLWATDAAGNQDFCQTFTFVDDNQGACQGPPLIAGKVATAGSQPVSGVNVSLNGGTEQQVVTGAPGVFQFEVPQGGDYTLSAGKEDNPLNGVTTLDMVLISRHILGLSPFEDPYKLLAADVNGSGSVTTSDLIAIRRLVLHMEEQFPVQKSWLFVQAGFSFPDPGHPFSVVVPQTISFNDLQSNEVSADFTGIKLGDVNGSADVR